MSSATAADVTVMESLPASPTRELLTNEESKSKKKSKSSSKPSLLKLLKDAVGKDLTRMSVPVYFNEPLSFLQRVTEDVQYYNILDKASDKTLKGTSKRLALISIFVISHYNSTNERTNKPFNPLLGETFEYIVPNDQVCILSEQVSHHPPMTALYAKGKQWEYYTCYEIKNKFYGNYLEIWPKGKIHIHFNDGDHYYYEQIHTFVNNILIGSSLWIDNCGLLTIHDFTNNQFVSNIKFKRCSSNSLLFSDNKSLGNIQGEIKHVNNDNDIIHSITGNWTKQLKIDNEIIWTAPSKIPKKHTGGFLMTRWAWNLNSEIVDEHTKQFYPKTDSRLRPDQRAVENGQYDLASREKDRIEKKQREKRKELEMQTPGYPFSSNSDANSDDIEANDADSSNDIVTNSQARWFELKEDIVTGDLEWRYKGGYFEQKLKAVIEEEQWPADELSDIF